MKNVQFVIANEVKQSYKPLIIKEIATAHMRLAMTGSEFFKGQGMGKCRTIPVRGMSDTKTFAITGAEFSVPASGNRQANRSHKSKLKIG